MMGDKTLYHLVELLREIGDQDNEVVGIIGLAQVIQCSRKSISLVLGQVFRNGLIEW